MIVGQDHSTSPGTCLNCGKPLDTAFSVGDDATPSPGDFTVCASCGHLMVFAENLGLREPTEEEIVNIAGDERLIAAMRALAFAKKYPGG